MPKKRYNAEEIVHKLREADVLLSQAKTAPGRAVRDMRSARRVSWLLDGQLGFAAGPDD
jgi:hypothetical protein